ncbi:unnamed protein product [Prorocentrum cordatum]|uniref:DNA (cytosine-5-)-methyltransferase n=1 Tax=Prorocentrum cordatum TaxID=2364126 RepID=A0ABN9VVY5_9DINO|nr:unnamed protein product [Polarella glacialis]
MTLREARGAKDGARLGVGARRSSWGRLDGEARARAASAESARGDGVGSRSASGRASEQRNPTDADSRLADKGVLKAGEALRPGRLAGRLRAAAASQAAAPVRTAEGKCPSRSRSERQTRRPLGILELFAGCGRLSGACAQAGLRILCPIDVANGKHFDLLNSRVQCRARSTGSEDTNEVTRGLELALFSCRALRVCRQCGVTVSVENPASSGIWSYEPLKRELQKCSCSPVRYDACRYGAPFKKSTIFFTNAVSLGALDRRCNCRVPREILEGKVKVEGPSSGEPKAGALRSDRARARATRAGGSRQEGYLKSRSISAKTLRAHTEAVKLFYLFCKSAMVPTTTYQELDVAMEQHLHKLYFDGETISRPNNTVHGLMYEQNLAWSKTSAFPLTRKALQGYRKSSCSVSRDGAPWECAIFLAVFMARHGSIESVQAAGLTLLMFDTYLRILVAISLGRDQVAPPRARSGLRSFYPLIVAPKELGKPTKAGACDDTVLVSETAPERRPVLRAILVQILKAVKPGEYLFPDLAAQKYELIFRRACQALNFGDLKLCPRSLRHGGASVDALNGIDTLTIQKRGRWNVIASCRRYEKKGRILKQPSILGQARVQESVDELAWLVSRLPQLLCSAFKDRSVTVSVPVKVSVEWPDPLRPGSSGVAATVRLRSPADVALATVVARNVAVVGQGLALCRAGCEIFGFVEPKGPRRYHVRHRTGVHLLTLVGDFASLTVEGINPVGSKVCWFQRSGDELCGRVLQHVDAGLAICSLLATHVHRRLLHNALVPRPIADQEEEEEEGSSEVQPPVEAEEAPEPERH